MSAGVLAACGQFPLAADSPRHIKHFPDLGGTPHHAERSEQ
jgi:hypothetical protein